MRVIRLFIPFVFILFFFPNAPARAAGVVGNGTPASCTYAALAAAIVGGGTVTFSCGGNVTIDITEALFISATNVIIDGGNQVTLQGVPGQRILYQRSWGVTNATSTVTLRNLRIINASRTGAGSESNGAAIMSINQSANYDRDVQTLNIENVTFINNISTQTSSAGNPYDFGGGAIYTRGGILNVSNSTFSGNRSNGGAGGAIHGLGSNITITNSTFNGNIATATSSSSNNSGYGGVLYVDGALRRGGGGITITGSTFTNNSGANQGGVAYINLYTARNESFIADRSTFTGNSISGGAMGLGGALSGGGTNNGAGTVRMTITNSLFANNTASGGPRGSSGGAIGFAQAAVTTIANSTFTGNQALGLCSDCYNANGGAIYITNSSVPFTIVNTTIVNNHADWVGGGMTTNTNGVLRNSIVANNTASNGGNNWNIQFNCAGTIRNGGNNVQFKPTGGNDQACAPGVVVANPLLGALTNGVMTPQAGSPAIDAGSTRVCAAAPVSNRDQNGSVRPQGAACDIGAVETASALINIVKNGNFATAGTTGSPPQHWQIFAEPTNSAMAWRLQNGVFEFYRNTSPSGTTQAVVFQQTGVAVPVNSGLRAQIDIGNSSTSRKRVTVLLHNSSFNDLAMCTFWVPPNTGLRTYEITTRIGQAWTNATVSIYASTGDGLGWIRLDNVRLHQSNAISGGRTICDDPSAPLAVQGDNGADLIDNGNFSTTITPPGGNATNGWGTFATPANALIWRLQSGVFEFYRNGGSSGVILQNDPTQTAANTRLEATLQLGNNSSQRQRVTVLLHSSNFSDLAMCTFWLPPGAGLGTYAMRAYASQAWTAGTSISIYTSTSATAGWIRLDNVTLRSRPAMGLLGTECYQAGTTPADFELSIAAEAVELIAPTLEPTATPPMLEPGLLATPAPIELGVLEGGEGGLIEEELLSGGEGSP